MKRRIKLAAAVATLAALAAVVTPLAATSSGGPGGPDKPSRVLLLVLDGMRSDYLDRFDLPNLAALRDGGVSFPRATWATWPRSRSSATT
jgi:predicted AlkP superfamily pyrophosphatase or phosphodiesterase